MDTLDRATKNEVPQIKVGQVFRQHYTNWEWRVVRKAEPYLSVWVIERVDEETPLSQVTSQWLRDACEVVG